MRKKLQTLNKTYFINWTPDEVCQLLQQNAIKAEEMVQSSKFHTHKLIRELYLLACQACLTCSTKTNAQARLLCRYAKTIKKISHDYDNLFRRTTVIETTNSEQQEVSSVETIDRLQARLYYLMTQYSVHPCKHLAANIVQQLMTLCQHPHIELMPAQHHIYSHSINYWRSRSVNSEATQANRSVH